MWLTLLPEHDRLQIILSYDTDHQYTFRCLPWVLTKRYLNRYVFKGRDKVYTRNKQWALQVENEVYLWKVVFPLFQRQLFDLLWDLETYGEDNTFGMLSAHAWDIARTQNLFCHYQSHIQIQLLHEFLKHDLSSILKEMVRDVQKYNHDLPLIETVRANTLLLIWYQ